MLSPGEALAIATTDIITKRDSDQDVERGRYSEAEGEYILVDIRIRQGDR